MTLRITKTIYPATGEASFASSMGPIVLLHGWGSNSDTWQPLLEGLREFSELITLDLPGFDGHWERDVNVEEVLVAIKQSLPQRAILMGWSLGGMLATRLAASCPARISALITLASNLCFSEKEHWPLAMSQQNFLSFRESFVDDNHLSLKRFSGLIAQGDSRERELLKRLRAQVGRQRENVTPQWLNCLDILNDFDNRNCFSHLSVPGIHLFAEQDSLVPSDVADVIGLMNPKQAISVVPDAAHAIHWSNPNAVLEQLRSFFERQKFHLDKIRVAQSFSRAAETYDTVAQLQRDVGNHLFAQHLMASEDWVGVETVVDLGCGTGCFTEKLQQRFEASSIIGLDIAEGMLRYARVHKALGAGWLCGDAEALPLADESVDVMFSSLAIQWCENTRVLFSEIKRVLKPGGKFYFSTLGPRTLFELKSAWKHVDGAVHVNRFFSADFLQQEIGAARLELLAWESLDRVLYYPQLKNLTHELKALGAHNVNQGKPAGLTGRQHVQRFRTAYESYRVPQGIPATYEVYYGVIQA